ncbi:hypothetical protein ASC75_19320 [Aminobacter sp. DSM 101952]|nr:hypothetical protein ASC75_19320 [Aminobacter sp. DSM 101952]
MTNLDSITQKNVAMMEQTRATTARLAEASIRLSDLVEGFTLPGGRSLTDIATGRNDEFRRSAA